MQKILTTLILSFLGLFSSYGQTLSPEAFLGYEMGSNFTYHHRVIDFVEYLAGKHKDQVRLVQYGTSYEGRPLVVAILASAQNLSQLEQIRLNHLSRISMRDGEVRNAPRPGIAWLSYNVHGDEGATSEAAMEMMHALLAGDEKEMLNSLVVIIDPCLNPDGHSRYAGWYNQMKGAQPNASPIAREHSQPWPGGRFNHYLFDLNRDWAWQVQRETRMRTELYHQWMPHLHADFHEMGAGSSYYFPPASRPFHENVTTWQREFNGILGKYNRKYFDKHQLLYFTKTSYDLFYPSYGDTWPTFNGAIGMTYEQGGAGRAGLALARPDLGDTLTLKTRVSNHVAAGKATLAALLANKEKVVQEFENYFRDAKENAVGKYKTYIIKSGGKTELLRPVRDFLSRQQIEFGTVGSSFSAQAVDLSSNKNEKINFEPEDLVISAYQPQSHLIKVLFETNPVLEDSLTYDITSWGIGYIYGAPVYGLQSKREPEKAEPLEKLSNVRVAGAYAYLANWESAAQLKFLSELLRSGFRVRTANSDFEIEGNLFTAGALVLTRAGNEAFGDRFEEQAIALANKHQVKLFPVKTGMVTKGQDLGSGSIKVVKPLKIGLLSGGGVSPTAFGAIWHFFDQELGYPLTIFEKDHLNSQTLSQLDVLILSDGNYSSVLREEALAGLSEWVSAGGKLIAMEGAVNGLMGKKGFNLKRKMERKGEMTPPLKIYADRARESIASESAGGIFEVTLDASHPLAFGYNGRSYFSSVRDIYDLEYLQDGWNVGYLGSDSYRSGFVGEKAKPRLKHTLIFGVQESGKGKIIYMADNPLFRGFWENGKLLFGNAVFR